MTEGQHRTGTEHPLPSGTATFLFTDIQGSTELVQRLELDRWQEILDTHHRLLREQWSAHDGHEVKTEGDAFFVAFDRATDAVAACADAQRSLAAHHGPRMRRFESAWAFMPAKPTSWRKRTTWGSTSIARRESFRPPTAARWCFRNQPVPWWQATCPKGCR